MSKRHGLEQALKMMQDAGYGKIGENATFRMRWSTQKEMEGRFGDLSLDEDEYNGM
ncbi:MAG: hypothetical protein ACXAC5_02370 [Promethearchaeota archaeon]